MRELKKTAFLLEHFAVPSPGQQLLDRFLIGFSQNGAFRESPSQVSLWRPNASGAIAIDERKKAFGLQTAAELADACEGADAVVIAGWQGGSEPVERIVTAAMDHAPAGAPIFVEGLLASAPAAAAQLAARAEERRQPLLAGTAIPFAFRLPDVDLPAGARVREALVVVQGEFPSAELDGLEALLPFVEKRRNGERGIAKIRRVEGDAFWRAGEKGDWSWPLLASALSRSHTPQGNALVDCRTEDLVGLGLVQTLAKRPRGWLLQHEDGLQSAILVLDGVVKDINVAIGLRGGDSVSCQLFRPPAPQQEHYSRLAGALLEFFTSGHLPWPLQRARLEAQVIASMKD